MALGVPFLKHFRVINFGVSDTVKSDNLPMICLSPLKTDLSICCSYKVLGPHSSETSLMQVLFRSKREGYTGVFNYMEKT